MEKLFGIHTDDLLIGLLVVFGIGAFVLTLMALRHRVIFKMALRNPSRRRAQTLLIILGLMLAAMLFSASFATGDTLTHSMRSLYVEHLGQVDIMVMPEDVEFEVVAEQIIQGQRSKYFDVQDFDLVNETLSDLENAGIVEEVAPAIIETVPVKAESGLNEPAITLLGLDPKYLEKFDPLIDDSGNHLSVATLEEMGMGHVFMSYELAEDLGIDLNDNIEDNINVFLTMQETSLKVVAIYESGGNPSTFSVEAGGASIVMPLSHVQALRESDQINFILVNNRGGAITGAEQTDMVLKVLDPALEDSGLRAVATKQDALDNADEGGAMFSTMFLVMGSFSIIAGILLIFLIFVMLAAERKPELGMTRAIGAQRGHIIRLFTFEGILYAIIASAIGAGLGLLLSWGMIQLMAKAYEWIGFEIVYHFTTRGLAIAYLLGVVFTLIVVVVSAWRVSRLNIISAIKDIPEPVQAGKSNVVGLIMTLLLLWFGIMMVPFGIQEKMWTPYSLGISFIIISMFLLLRKLRLPDRVAFTLMGVFLLAYWLSPIEWHPNGEQMGAGFDMLIWTGVMLVAAAVFIVMYNSDLLLSAIMRIFGRLRAFTPMIKTSVAYPMASRFRTGMALAMFSLIIFTLVMFASMIASFEEIINDTDRVSGGFHIRGEVSYTNPIDDMEAALNSTNGVGRDDFEAIGSLNAVFVKMRDDVEDIDEWDEIDLLPLVGVDEGYSQAVTYDLELMTAEYDSSDKVWQAMAQDPWLAVISPDIVPTRSSHMGGEEIDLVVGEGDFYIEDDIIPQAVFVEVQNAASKEVHKLQVIGVLDRASGGYAPPVTTSQQTISEIFGEPINPSEYRFVLAPNRIDDASEVAKNLETQFANNGMNVKVMADELANFWSTIKMVFNLMMAFTGLGLIVGIAALGVIAARSVVERRQQIGMLRAIGFRQGMVQFSFLLESSFVALLGILIGVALGVATSLLFMEDSGVEGMKAIIPWTQIVLIIVLAYIASLITTFIPAYQAARIYPAEALRYE